MMGFLSAFISFINSTNPIFKFNTIFESQTIFSFEVKMTKDMPEIFRYACKKFNITDPKEALFIDDTQKFVQTAQSIGMNSILFIDQDDLIRNLQKFNVSI